MSKKSESKILKAEFGAPDRPLRLAESEIPCYVLEDGTRVLNQTAMLKALGMSRGGTGGRGGDRLAKFMGTKSISPHVGTGLRKVTEHPMTFRNERGFLAYGYEATVLVDICDAVLQARKMGTLDFQQKHIADGCEALVRSFAKVGIIALVDEVTGYQQARGRFALQKFLDKFLQEEARKWTKTFPDEFFEAIFMMKGWSWEKVAQGKKPAVIGHYINNYVYARLGPGVLTELQKLNPVLEAGRRGKTHHQFTSADFGAPELKQRIRTLIDFAKAAGHNWTNWTRMIERTYPKFGDQLSLRYSDPDEPSVKEKE